MGFNLEKCLLNSNTIGCFTMFELYGTNIFSTVSYILFFVTYYRNAVFIYSYIDNLSLCCNICLCVIVFMRVIINTKLFCNICNTLILFLIDILSQDELFIKIWWHSFHAHISLLSLIVLAFTVNLSIQVVLYHHIYL